MTLVLLLFSSTVIPLATSKAEEIRVIFIEKAPSAVVKLPLPWTRVDADTLLHVTSVTLGGDTLAGVQLFHFDQAFRLIDMTEAQEAHFANRTWTLRRGFHRRFNRDGTVTATEFDSKPITLALIPNDFTGGLGGEPELMTFRDIRESANGYINTARNSRDC